jgi:hypothetical protein
MQRDSKKWRGLACSAKFQSRRLKYYTDGTALTPLSSGAQPSNLTLLIPRHFVDRI